MAFLTDSCSQNGTDRGCSSVVLLDYSCQGASCGLLITAVAWQAIHPQHGVCSTANPLIDACPPSRKGTCMSSLARCTTPISCKLAWEAGNAFALADPACKLQSLAPGRSCSCTGCSRSQLGRMAYATTTTTQKENFKIGSRLHKSVRGLIEVQTDQYIPIWTLTTSGDPLVAEF